jgi:FtsP/CotA-like multicopper oxidase with cupredoxin domain
MSYGRAFSMAASIGLALLTSAAAAGAAPVQTPAAGRASFIPAAASGIPTLVSASGGSYVSHEYAGSVVDANKTTGTLVIADVGPLLASGRSEVTRRQVHVTQTTEFTRVERARGAAPSGWVGGYVETAAPRWDVKPGDFVAVTVTPGVPGEAEAVKITVVDIGPELPAAVPALATVPSGVRR